MKIARIFSFFKKKSSLTLSNYVLKGISSYQESPNVGDFLDLTSDIFIILHYTATIDAKTAIDILTDPERAVSAHLVIDRDGSITQLVPFNKIAWHAGVSEWKGLTSLNKYSIGIEIVNAGKLEKDDSGVFLTWDGKEIPSNQVYTHSDGTYWQLYTEKQLNILKKIIKILKSSYKVSEILRHSDISPDRKIDPGPALTI